MKLVIKTRWEINISGDNVSSQPRHIFASWRREKLGKVEAFYGLSFVQAPEHFGKCWQQFCRFCWLGSDDPTVFCGFVMKPKPGNDCKSTKLLQKAVFWYRFEDLLIWFDLPPPLPPLFLIRHRLGKRPQPLWCPFPPPKLNNSNAAGCFCVVSRSSFLGSCHAHTRKIFFPFFRSLPPRHGLASATEEPFPSVQTSRWLNRCFFFLNYQQWLAVLFFFLAFPVGVNHKMLWASRSSRCPGDVFSVLASHICLLWLLRNTFILKTPDCPTKYPLNSLLRKLLPLWLNTLNAVYTWQVDVFALIAC